MSAGPLAAQERALTQYGIRFWDQRDGLPQNSSSVTAQTPDGYVWIGTEEGLARFDGRRFTTFDRSTSPAFATSDVRTLITDEDGALWIGTMAGGLLRYLDGEFSSWSVADGLPSSTVLSLAVAGGDLWIGTDEGLARLRNGRIEAVGAAEGVSNASVYALIAARDGGVWVGTEAGEVYRLNAGADRVAGLERLREHSVQALLEEQDGTLWIGTRTGLFRRRGDTLQRVPLGDAGADAYASAFHQDSTGAIWIGTRTHGVFRLADGRLEALGTAQGLPGDDIRSLREDREGNLWVGMIGGVAMLYSGAFIPLTTREGLPGDIVLPILQDRSGALWFGTYGQGLARRAEGRMRVFTEADGLTSDVIFSLAETPDGALWIGTRQGVTRLQDGRTVQYGSESGLPSSTITALYTDPSGTLWGGTPAGLVRWSGSGFTSYAGMEGFSNRAVQVLLKDAEASLWIGTQGGLNRLKDDRIEAFGRQDGLASDAIQALHIDGSGTLWVGTNAGLSRFRDGRFATIGTREGLFQDQVFRILEDDYGYLWVSGNRGIARLALDELNAVADGRAASVVSVIYDERSGMPSSEANGGIQPAGWKDDRGRLWFPTMKGAAMVDPATLERTSTSLSVIIERLLIDGEEVELRPGEETLSLPAGVDRLEIDYTAANFTEPRDLVFHYMLEGFDTAWAGGGDVRSATYTNLPPGRYRFRVQARGRGQAWGDDAALGFSLAPHFYQTWPFRLLLLAGLAGLVFAGDRLRVLRHRSRERELLDLAEERERAERRYRALFENSNDLVLTTDLEGRITSLNRTAEQVLGYGSADLVGSRLDILAPPESRPVVDAWVAHAQEEAGEASAAGVQEIELLSRDGRRIPVEASVQPIREEGRAVGVQAMLRDVTERRDLEEQLRQVQKMEAIGRLAGGIAHDFNNLLSVIGGNAEMALMELPEGLSARQDLEEIRRASDRAADLTRQLLAFSRQQILQPEVLDLNDAVAATGKMLRRMIGENIRLATALDADPAWVYADPGQIEQVVMNLVVNARDAMPGGGRLMLETANVHIPTAESARVPAGDYILLRVRDTGTGMTKEVQERIFEPFFTTKEEGKGTGLGLATVYGIVEQSGGYLEVESEPGEGAAFSIYLPRAYAEGEKAGVRAHALDLPRGQGESILLVEDEDAVRSWTGRLLERLGYRVLAASGGRAALQLAETHEGSIHLLLTDVVMPGMGGPELARRLRADRLDLRVLYVSGYAGDAIAQQGLPDGETAFLAKPFTALALARKLRDVLDT